MGKTSAAALAPHARCASRLATAMRLHRWIPLFAAHNPLTDPHPFFSSFRDHYEDLRARRAALAAKYAELDKDVHHLCDGLTTLLPQRPSRLPEAKSLPPISSILAADCSASVFPPKQAKLASIARHEDWWACLAAWQAWDAAHPASDISARGATNFVAMSQHGAGQWLNLQPRTRGTRIQSVEFLYALQRRFGLYISAAIPAFAAASRVGDNYDPCGATASPVNHLATRGGGGKPFVQFWTQRLSAAVVTGDARRTLNAISACVRSALLFKGPCPVGHVT